ncbi:MAG TPA: PepSY domain-containing protein [Polyangiaceae bacterium]|nr:PepSY domain-containing protein [Polyangiaceae bacterium]
MTKKTSIRFTLAIGLAAAALGVGPNLAAADQTLKLDELPAPVRSTVQREVKKGTITDIEKDHENGNVVYEIEFDEGGKNWEIDVAPDGKLLQRHED